MGRKRVFLIVLDGLGIGALPDAAAYGDAGSHTLAACGAYQDFALPALARLGLFHVEGSGLETPSARPEGAYGRAAELSAGKDTTTGHWEMAGLPSLRPFPTFSQGFPPALLEDFSRRTGRGVLCNRPYSGTQVIQDYGLRHMAGGDWIVYTSADSVFQLAAHEEKVPLEELYQACAIAREICQGEWAVGRVIARPFAGNYPGYFRTQGRHDYSLPPHGPTMLDMVGAAGMEVLAVGKIWDIFGGRGISRHWPTGGNAQGMEALEALAGEDFSGLCFANLVDFDMLYGHRNDVEGFARALKEFDRWLSGFLQRLGRGDLLIITADHGCDPSTPSTDHSREYVPVLLYGEGVVPGADLGTRSSFGDVAASVLAHLGINHDLGFASMLGEKGREYDGAQ